MKSGAESGWDFTARWFFGKDGEISDKIQHIQTRRNIPVDLNAFLYKGFTVMYKFYMIIRKPEDANYWLNLSESWKDAIENVFYNEEDGMW